MRTTSMLGAGVAAMAVLAMACARGPEHVGASAAQPSSEVAAAAAQAERAPTRENGQRVADALMAQWRRDHPGRDWVAAEHEKHVIQPPHDNGGLIGEGQGATYGRVTEQDVETWRREVTKAVAEGSRIFHDADALGSPIAVSCDMCHPDAANTHPETYPKFQVQLGRVVLLRDMINWCVQQPVRGEPLAPDGPELRALEAYILAQRKGTPLDYGRR